MTIDDGDCWLENPPIFNRKLHLYRFHSGCSIVMLVFGGGGSMIELLHNQKSLRARPGQN